MDEIITFAQEQGYDSAVYVRKWREYEVYEPIFDNKRVNTVGIPLMILVGDNKIRMTTVDETFEYIKEHRQL